MAERKVYKTMAEVMANKDDVMKRFSNTEIDFLYSTFVTSENFHDCYAPTPRDWGSFWMLSDITRDKNTEGMDPQKWLDRYNKESYTIDIDTGLPVLDPSKPPADLDFFRNYIYRLQSTNFLSWLKSVPRNSEQQDSSVSRKYGNISTNKGAYSVLFPLFNLKETGGLAGQDVVVEINGWKLIQSPTNYTEVDKSEKDAKFKNPPGFRGYLGNNNWKNFISSTSYVDSGRTTTVVKYPYDDRRTFENVPGSFKQEITDFIISNNYYSNRQKVFAIRARHGLEYVKDAFISLNESQFISGDSSKKRLIQCSQPNQGLFGTPKGSPLYIDPMTFFNSKYSVINDAKNGIDLVRFYPDFRKDLLKISKIDLTNDTCLENKLVKVNWTIPDLPFSSVWKTRWNGNDLPPWGDPKDNTNFCNTKFKELIKTEWERRHPGNNDTTGLLRYISTDPGQATWANQSLGKETTGRDLPIHNEIKQLSSVKKDFDLSIMQPHEIEYLSELTKKYIEGNDAFTLEAERKIFERNQYTPWTDCGMIYEAFNWAPTSNQFIGLTNNKTPGNTVDIAFDIGALYGPIGNGKLGTSAFNDIKNLSEYGGDDENSGFLLKKFIFDRYSYRLNFIGSNPVRQVPKFILGDGGKNFKKAISQLDKIIKTVNNNRKNGKSVCYFFNGKPVSDQEIVFYLRYKYGIAYSPREYSKLVETSLGKETLPMVRGYMVTFHPNYTHDNYIKYVDIEFSGGNKNSQELNNNVWNGKSFKFTNRDIYGSFCHTNYLNDNGAHETVALASELPLPNDLPFVSTSFDERSADSRYEPIIKGFIGARNYWSKTNTPTPGDNTTAFNLNMITQVKVMTPTWNHCIYMSDIIAHGKASKAVIELDDWATYVEEGVKKGHVLEVPYEFSGFTDKKLPGYKSVEKLKKKDEGISSTKQYVPCGGDPTNPSEAEKNVIVKYSTIYISGLDKPNDHPRQQRPWSQKGGVFNGGKEWDADSTTKVEGSCSTQTRYMRHIISPNLANYLSDQLYSCLENILTANALSRQYIRHGKYLKMCKPDGTIVNNNEYDFYKIFELITPSTDGKSKFDEIASLKIDPKLKTNALREELRTTTIYKQKVLKWKYLNTFGGAVFGYILTWLKYGARVPYTGLTQSFSTVIDAKTGKEVIQHTYPLSKALHDFGKYFTVIGLIQKTQSYLYKLEASQLIEDPAGISLGTANYVYSVFQGLWSLGVRFGLPTETTVGIATETAAVSASEGALLASRVLGVALSWWASIIVGLTFIAIDIVRSALKEEASREEFLKLVDDASKNGWLEGPYADSFGEIRIKKSDSGEIPIGLETETDKNGVVSYKKNDDGSFVPKYRNFSYKPKIVQTSTNYNQINEDWLTKKDESGKTKLQKFVDQIDTFDCKVLLKIAKKSETDVEMLFQEDPNRQNQDDYGVKKSVPYRATAGTGKESIMYNKILNSYPNTYNVGFIRKGKETDPNTTDLVEFSVNDIGVIRSVIPSTEISIQSLGRQTYIPKTTFLYPASPIANNTNLKNFISCVTVSNGEKYKNLYDTEYGKNFNRLIYNSKIYDETLFDDNNQSNQNVSFKTILTYDAGFNKWGHYIPKGVRADKTYMINRPTSFVVDDSYENKNSRYNGYPQITDKEVIWLIRKKYSLDTPRIKGNCCSVFDTSNAIVIDDNCEYLIDLANEIVIKALEEKCECHDCK